jgi:hypothetical protein
VSDLEAESLSHSGFSKSDIKSDIESDVNLTLKLASDCQNSKNQDRVGNPVNLMDNMTVGGVSPNSGASDSTVTLTPDKAIALASGEKKYTEINVDDDGWGKKVRVSLPQKPSIEEADSTAVEDAIASPTQEIWAWSRETGECLGQVLCDGGDRLKIRRTGEPSSRAKWHERNQITFKNPTVSAVSLNTPATTGR